ncbi:Nn.00g035190.m01.CDS01 [Neocucurbitaria sp. VM-36]
MATNAPYYQMRAGQFINATNAAQSQFVPEDGEYDLSPAAVASPVEHPSMYTEQSAPQSSADNTIEENHNLVELLEAATTARHAAQAMDVDGAGNANMTAQGKGKRKRVSSSPLRDASYLADDACSSKRRRVDVPTDPQLQASNNDLRGNSEHANLPPSNESLLSDARAAGVHSAAALFRRSSERTSRKYTRPPMSKLFMSLQLSPESFLQLQAQAKAYMLDTAHPERQNCVGNRGKGDTDMVKLRLFNCVRDFLDDEVGEQFFGEHVEKPGQREAIEAARALGEEKTPNAEARLTWPRDGNKIIGLVTPLMRRMVTNERQRQYAIETRKGGAKKKETDSGMDTTSLQDHSILGNEVEQQSQSTFDPSFDQPQQVSRLASPSTPNDAKTKLKALTGRHSLHPDHERKPLAEAEASVSSSAPAKLPTDAPAEHNLHHINIFLTLPPQNSRPPIKIDEIRITPKPPQKHLAWYEWNDFLQHVVILLQKAKVKYPEVERLVIKESRIGAESLRGLAAAANALSNEDANGEDAAPRSAPPQESRQQNISQFSQGMERSTSGEPPLPRPDALLEDAFSIAPTVPTTNESQGFNTDLDTKAKHLPRYVIKTVGPDGWKIISNAKNWYDVLLEKAFAIWADGVCNVLIELVDIPTPVQLTVPTPFQGGIDSGGGSGKKRDGE